MRIKRKTASFMILSAVIILFIFHNGINTGVGYTFTNFDDFLDQYNNASSGD